MVIIGELIKKPLMKAKNFAFEGEKFARSVLLG
jgi:hypothetical protein